MSSQHHGASGPLQGVTLSMTGKVTRKTVSGTLSPVGLRIPSFTMEISRILKAIPDDRDAVILQVVLWKSCQEIWRLSQRGRRPLPDASSRRGLQRPICTPSFVNFPALRSTPRRVSRSVHTSPGTGTYRIRDSLTVKVYCHLS